MSTEVTLTDTAYADPAVSSSIPGHRQQLPSQVPMLCRADVGFSLNTLLQTHTLLASALRLCSLCLQC